VVRLLNYRFSDEEHAFAAALGVAPRPDMIQVRWKGPHKPTWESVHILGGYHDDMVKEFLLKHKLAICEQQAERVQAARPGADAAAQPQVVAPAVAAADGAPVPAAIAASAPAAAAATSARVRVARSKRRRDDSTQLQAAAVSGEAPALAEEGNMQHADEVRVVRSRSLAHLSGPTAPGLAAARRVGHIGNRNTATPLRRSRSAAAELAEKNTCSNSKARVQSDVNSAAAAAATTTTAADSIGVRQGLARASTLSAAAPWRSLSRQITLPLTRVSSAPAVPHGN